MSPTTEQMHDWALAIAEWADKLSSETHALAEQSRRFCEKLCPEKYREGQEGARG